MSQFLFPPSRQHLEDVDGGLDGGGDVGKGADGGGDGGRMRVEADGGARDDAQRAFGAHEERRQVVAGRGFLSVTTRT